MVIERFSLNEIFPDITLTAHLHTYGDSRERLRPAVILCPSGDYLSINEEEAEYVAIQFLAKGFQSFILNYSIGAPFAHFPAPFLDLANAVVLVKNNARRFGIDPDRIVVCGLSTGGHVASMLGTLWHSPLFPDKNGKPSAMILGYPLLDPAKFRDDLLSRNTEYTAYIEMMFRATFGISNPDQTDLDKWCSTLAVTPQTIPTFLWSYHQDQVVNISQTNAFSEQLKNHQIAHQFHNFKDGRHGEYKPTLDNNWLDLAIKWLNWY